MPFIPDNQAKPLDKRELQAMKSAKKAGGFFQRLSDSMKETTPQVGQQLMQRGRNIQQSTSYQGPAAPLVRRVNAPIHTAGQLAGGVSDIVGGALKVGYKSLVNEDRQQGIKDLLYKGANTSGGQMTLGGVQKVAEGYGKFKKAAPETARLVEDAGNILSVIPIGKGSSVAGRETLKVSRDVVNASKYVASQVDDPAKQLLKAERAVGQIVQGKKKDIAPALRVLSSIDTKGAKTYADVRQAIDTNLGNLGKAMDEVLSKDTAPRLLQNLEKVSDVGGVKVSTNYVKQALDHLGELYAGSNDAVQAQAIKNLVKKAETSGLTVKEINEIAKQYGSEFGQKAFSKLGEARTTVNAVAYENTRKGVKDTLRGLLPDETAKKLDKQISEHIQTQELVKKMEEATQKLLQRVNERGVVQKVGSVAGKVVDAVSLNSISGFLGGVLKQSNVGLKSMNALDLQAALRRNIEIIERAAKSKNPLKFNPESETGKFMKSLKGKGGLNLNDVSGGKKGYSDPLLSQARKYKTPEEFVKAHGEPVYHGTSARFTEFDEKKLGSTQGFDEPGFSFTTDIGSATRYASTYPQKPRYKWTEADRVAAEKSNVIEAYFNKENPLTIEDLNKLYSEGKIKTAPKTEGFVRPEQYIDNNRQAIKEASAVTGKKVFKVTAEGTTNYSVLDSSAIKTKSQLTDLWKKAQGGKKDIKNSPFIKSIGDRAKENVGKVKEGNKIANRILNEMADFTEYAAKQKTNKVEYVLDEIRARKIAEKLGINPDVSNLELAKKFGKLLEKNNWKPKL